GRGGRNGRELELIDTGGFEDGRYFDVTIEYAKAAPDDILLRVSAVNRGPDPAPLHMLPQLWARNTWAWYDKAERPLLSLQADNSVAARHPDLEAMHLYADGGAFLFCENETNVRRLFGDEAPGPFKDGLNDFIVHGERRAINTRG